MRSISISSLIKSTSFWSKQAGVRWQLLLAVIVLWLASRWLHNEYGQDDSNLWLVMQLFLTFLLWTILGLFSISLLTALSTWVLFIVQVRSKRIDVQSAFGDGQKAEAGWVPLRIQIKGPLLRPLLGTVQARLVFSNKRLSERILLDENIPRPKHWWRQAIRGQGQTLLHDRGIYDVEKVLVTFCDMFGLVALPYTLPCTQQLYTLPRLQQQQKIKAQPNSTEEQLHRIDIPKRVEGEYVNYKEFEAGDNIQRIVWKIYAKSGQLVVRIPETKDPYASHLYLYASFFNGYSETNGAFETELLNTYKDRLRTVFEALQRNGYDVRMPQDQETPRLAGLSEKKNDLFRISASHWQPSITPMAYVQTNKAAFVCMSSLVPCNELETMIKRLPESVPVLVVKLSEAIASPFTIQLKDIFFRPEPQPADHLRQPWLISSLRNDLLKNEREIEKILKQRGNSWLTNAINIEK